MKTIKLVIAMCWQILIAVTSPFWIGLMYMDITGNSKGYNYDLGSEKDFYIICGIIELVIWCIVTIPIMVWLCKKFFAVKKEFVGIPIIVFTLCFGISVSLIGWNEFLSVFGI